MTNRLVLGPRYPVTQVSADDALGILLWGEYFTKVQGYMVKHNILYQCNKSILGKNGCMSSGRRTNHTNAKYFMITARVKRGEGKLVQCGTECMWADVLNKPKQGTPCWVFRAELMNILEMYDDEKEHLNTHPVPREKTRRDTRCQPAFARAHE